jgi:hypothetical protein
MMIDTEDNAIMLTTVDNPFNPFTRFKEWLAYDIDKGYDTPSFLARVCIDSYELSDADQAQAIGDAIREIARENVNGLYRIVSKVSARELGLL